MAATTGPADMSAPITPDDGRRGLASAWLALGVTALALAGIFALLLVIARAPGTGALFPTQDFFRVALIVHVDQSVLIWFLAFGGVLWALAVRPMPGLSWTAFGVAAAGCLLVAASPFLGAADPLLNNYVPVLDHPLFVSALALFALGVLLQLGAYLARVRAGLRWGDPVGVGTLTAALATLVAALSLAWTWASLSPVWEGKAFYEYLFWGPGHVLQFAYTQILLVAWIWLVRAQGRDLPLGDRALSAFLVLGVLPLLLVPVVHALYAPDSAETRLAFTRLMQWGNGLAAVPIGLAVLIALARHGDGRKAAESLPVRRALAASLTLFAAGGVLSLLIAGSNTIVPAHYHGSIVGVTLALMGLAYHLLPRLGFGTPAGRMARVQPWIYGGGQLLHIGGLAVSGALGIQRKTAGAAQGLDSLTAKLSMGVMGIGGLLAVIGGILFVLVVIGALRRRA
ncbi:MAG: cbb3-type cytochrome c oxidase subunit I [Bdellovibrio bacteriovorus]